MTDRERLFLELLNDALWQGGDTRKVDGEYQVGHMFLSTWEIIHELLLREKVLEFVPGQTYWARMART